MASTQQEQIIRQSQIKLALDYFNACNVCPSLADLVKTTAMLEKFIKDGYSPELIDKFEKTDEFIQQQYHGK